jgi:16S rRNA (adenine1518-N6/adenine1519-N6)-dimethyltransferase
MQAILKPNHQRKGTCISQNEAIARGSACSVLFSVSVSSPFRSKMVVAFAFSWFATTSRDIFVESIQPIHKIRPRTQIRRLAMRNTLFSVLNGWIERNGEWEWIEDDPSYVAPAVVVKPSDDTVTTTPKLPSGTYRPKQSLGQNYLRDPNTVAKILRAFHTDAMADLSDGTLDFLVELGPGAGALTDALVAKYGVESVYAVEIDPRSVALLRDKHPLLQVEHADVLQIQYADIWENRRQQVADARDMLPPLCVIGNLPYYITSQILFALADASHQGTIRSATVTMQWEVGQRMVAPTHCKDYGILSVVFQIYCSRVRCHFKIPPTVFYPQPRVDSALLGLHFLPPTLLQQRFAGVQPMQLRRLVTATFQQRRKTLRKTVQSLGQELYSNNPELLERILRTESAPVPDVVQQAAQSGDPFAQKQSLPRDWSSRRPEELHPAEFIELTRLVFSGRDLPPMTELGTKVWRKRKHGADPII